MVLNPIQIWGNEHGSPSSAVIHEKTQDKWLFLNRLKMICMTDPASERLMHYFLSRGTTRFTRENLPLESWPGPRLNIHQGCVSVEGLQRKRLPTFLSEAIGGDMSWPNPEMPQGCQGAVQRKLLRSEWLTLPFQLPI